MRAIIVGAGLAGLSAAVALVRAGVDVELIEGAPYAGGRCRSYFDPTLGVAIDNGNHLVLSGNAATFAYLRAIGAEDRLVGPPHAEFKLFDIKTGKRWTIRPNDGVVPFWLLDPGRRPPATSLREYLALGRLTASRTNRRIDSIVSCSGGLWSGLVEPVLTAALNTAPQAASAALAGAVLRQSLARGGRACAPRIAQPSLSAAFIDPALSYLEKAGARVRLGARVRRIDFDLQRATTIVAADAELSVGADHVVILAVPPWAAEELIPSLEVPNAFSPIVNGHFRVRPRPDAMPMVGLIGGAAQWVFAFADRMSVTVSAADAIVDDERGALARGFWSDVAATHGLIGDMPAWQIVKERRATFLATPEQEARRPATRTRWRNLFLAGDWTATGLPATIEGAVRSGSIAADLALKTPNTL